MFFKNFSRRFLMIFHKTRVYTGYCSWGSQIHALDSMVLQNDEATRFSSVGKLFVIFFDKTPPMTRICDIIINILNEQQQIQVHLCQWSKQIFNSGRAWYFLNKSVWRVMITPDMAKSQERNGGITNSRIYFFQLFFKNPKKLNPGGYNGVICFSIKYDR